MRKILFFLLGSLMITSQLFSQIKLSVQQTATSAPSKMKISLSFTNGGTDYSGQGMNGYFFILKSPASCGDVTLSNFVGYSGQSNLLVFVNRSTVGADKYVMYELNVAGTAPGTWVYPNVADLISFDINIANGCKVELGPDADPNVQALIDGYYGGGTSGAVYGSDINMNGNPTVDGYVTPFIFLPVAFSSYTVNCNDRGAIVKWSTSSEQNSNKFEIQRSSDGVIWKTVGTVAAAGNSSVTRNYEYLDISGGGAAQYRIRQVDLDGNFKHTDVKYVNCHKSSFNVVIYPVPANDKLNVVIKSDSKTETGLRVVDASGKTVRIINAQINIGNNYIIIPTDNLVAGQYILLSTDPSVKLNNKFTVIH